MFLRTVSSSTLFKSRTNLHTIKITEANSISSVIYTLDKVTNEIFSLGHAPDLIIVTTSRDDVKMRANTYPLKGPEYEFTFEPSTTDAFNITFNIFNCDQEADEDSDFLLRNILKDVL